MSTPVPMFARLETYALLLALFILITQGAYLSPAMQVKTEGAATLVSVSEPTGPMHLVQWVVAFGIVFLIGISHWRAVFKMFLRMKLLSATALLATISCLWSVDPLLSLRSGIYLLFDMMLVFYLVQRFSSRDLMRLLMALGLLVAALSVATAIVLPGYAWTTAGSYKGLHGVFVAKNLLGNDAVLLLTPALFVMDMRIRARVGYCFVLLGLVALSYSVQAWVAALFCLGFAGVGFLFHRLRTRDAIWIAYVTLLPMLFASIVLLTYWTDILQFVGKDPTMSGRTTIWGAVLLAILKRPLLGWGYNAFWQGMKGESGAVLVIIHFPIAQAQDGFLELLLSLGGIGLVAVLATFAQAFRNVVKCFWRRASEGAEWYFLIILLTLFYAIGEADLLEQNSLQWMMYLMACAGLSIEAGKHLPAPGSAAR